MLGLALGWTPPPPKWKKLNFDGASRGNPGVPGYGVVIKDEEGCLVKAICGPVGVATNNIAEITTLEEGLKLSCSLGCTKVMIEGDSQIILNGIIKNGFINWRLDGWIPRIKLLTNKLQDFQVRHIYQEGNKVADYLANTGISKARTIVISPTENELTELQKMLHNDSVQIPRKGIR
ncbi:uncharacterized protein LOC131858463 [Cryptomeria japonica]|uniref:uncharacterized protein LOC131858463 n=1 Tax=Cryptomeria japonica TaxID=3369 RepID=UPI0027DA9233|nr:uncharacterized protein LOC131858463 [Cryptomeria japonica]